MRLTCPNCEAQYEVPDEVIPEAGRDVQCSNCGDTWFQYHPDHIPDIERETIEDEDPENPANWQDMPDAASETPDMAEDHDLADQATEWDETGTEAQAPTPEATRSELDPGVRDILQEEARREAEARAADRGGVETQPDLGLGAGTDDEAARRSREARSRVARLRGEPDPAEDDVDDAIDPSSRRDLLPNIDEINSSLRSENNGAAEDYADAGYQDAETGPRRKSGFGRGFLLVVLLAVIALLVYVYAAAITELVPAAGDTLEAYVSQVDQLRLWLDGQVRALLLWLDSQSSASG